MVACLAQGMTHGAGIEVGMQGGKQVLGQVKDNWDNGRSLTDIDPDCINVDWADVGISAGVGMVAPGLFSTAKNVYKSGQAIKTISGQAANTANRATKLQGRINAHKSTIKKQLMVQGGWQGIKQGGKCVFGEDKKPCEK